MSDTSLCAIRKVWKADWKAWGPPTPFCIYTECWLSFIESCNGKQGCVSFSVPLIGLRNIESVKFISVLFN